MKKYFNKCSFLFLLVSSLFLVQCSSKGKSGDEEESLAKNMSPEEQADLKARQKAAGGDVGKLGSLYKAKNWKALKDEASKVLAKDPNNLKALSALGLYHMENGQPVAARLFFDKALIKHKKAAGLYNNIGVLQLREKNLVAAYQSFKKAHDLDSDNPVIATNLASILVRHMDYVAAETLVEDAYQSLRNNPDVANNYGIVLRTQGQFEESAKVYGKAVAGNVRHIPLNLNYAILLVDYLKNYPKARQYTNKLEFLNPTDNFIVDKIEILQRTVETAPK